MDTLDLFFISYDEPNADFLWKEVVAHFPHAKRIHGIKGFDAAYKACAAQSTANRFFTIDGDNEISPTFSQLTIPENLLQEKVVLSWGARNSINGLCYGNGGIKCWNKNLALEMSTHEADSENVDFCFKIPYYQMPEILSTARIHDSPYQAFRAGFREGVKLSLVKGKKPEIRDLPLKDFVWWQNLDRLKIWCSVGMEKDNGIWAIYGARLGCHNLFFSEFDHTKIKDYDWFLAFWKETIWPAHSSHTDQRLKNKLIEECERIGSVLSSRLGLDLCLMDSDASRFFQSVYQNPVRSGMLVL